jgi:F-type H+-transporting ATPase subunit gamma
MPSLAELRKKVKGVTATRKITRAMKMVAGARFGRAQAGFNGSRRFMKELDTVIAEVLSVTGALPDFIEILTGHKAGKVKKTGLVVISGDKGLCGDFNNSVIREGDAVIRREAGGIGALFTVGRKSCDHFRKRHKGELREYSNVFVSLDFNLAEKIITDMIDAIRAKELTGITVVSANFVSMMKFAVTEKQLIPLTVEKAEKFRDALMEPLDETEMLQALVPMVLKARLYKMIRESFAAELAARMRAMDNATTNAGTLIDRITLEMNKVRQATITREIAEIIGTNEVVK